MRNAVRAIFDMRRSIQSMQITILNARYVMNQCVKSIRQSRSYLSLVASIRRISSYQHLWIKCADYLTSRSRHADHLLKLDSTDTLLARAPQGLTPRLKGASRWVAKVLVGALCLSGTQSAEAQLDATKSIKALADYQLTDKQYKCHNQIIYRESTWKIDAVNGSHHGYYQIRSKHIKGKPYDYQFWMYWYYVAYRYGITKYDEPNYCKALHHLKTKGWQ
jgi:hypothetical protein